MAECLTPQTPNLEDRDSSLACCVVSLDKELYYTLSLFTQVYKWVPVTYCWGLPWMDLHPLQGGSNTPRCSMLRKMGYARAVWAFGSCAPLPLPYINTTTTTSTTIPPPRNWVSNRNLLGGVDYKSWLFCLSLTKWNQLQ